MIFIVSINIFKPSWIFRNYFINTLVNYMFIYIHFNNFYCVKGNNFSLKLFYGVSFLAFYQHLHKRNPCVYLLKTCTSPPKNEAKRLLPFTLTSPLAASFCFSTKAAFPVGHPVRSSANVVGKLQGFFKISEFPNKFLLGRSLSSSPGMNVGSWGLGHPVLLPRSPRNFTGLGAKTGAGIRFPALQSVDTHLPVCQPLAHWPLKLGPNHSLHLQPLDLPVQVKHFYW